MSFRKSNPNPAIMNATANLSTLHWHISLNFAAFTIVDFCSGGGHVAIAVAYLLPNCQVVLVENKYESLHRARLRCEALGLTNVRFCQCNLDQFRGHFDIGVSLHACGGATDLVVEKCFRAGASFVSVPCCYGGIDRNSPLNETLAKALEMLHPEVWRCDLVWFCDSIRDGFRL